MRNSAHKACIQLHCWQTLDSKHNNLQQDVDPGEVQQYRTDEIKILKLCSLTMHRYTMDEEHATQHAHSKKTNLIANKQCWEHETNETP